MHNIIAESVPLSQSRSNRYTSVISRIIRSPFAIEVPISFDTEDITVVGRLLNEYLEPFVSYIQQSSSECSNTKAGAREASVEALVLRDIW